MGTLIMLMVNILITANCHKINANSIIKVDNRMFNGTIAKDGQFPYMVLLLARERDISRICSGSLIRLELILTAAHCIVNIRNLSNIIAFAGMSDFIDYAPKRKNFSWDKDMPYNSKSLQFRRGLKTHIHNLYYKNDTFDVGVMKVTHAFLRTRYVSTIKYTLELLQPGTKCIKHGFGYSGDDSREIQLKYFETNAVQTDHLKCGAPTQKGYFYCAQFEYSTICTGDSGGPLVCDGKIYGVNVMVILPKDDSYQCGSAVSEWFFRLNEESQLFLTKYSSEIPALSSSKSIPQCFLFVLIFIMSI